jgi:hypothetical protein
VRPCAERFRRARSSDCRTSSAAQAFPVWRRSVLAWDVPQCFDLPLPEPRPGTRENASDGSSHLRGPESMPKIGVRAGRRGSRNGPLLKLIRCVIPCASIERWSEMPNSCPCPDCEGAAYAIPSHFGTTSASLSRRPQHHQDPPEFRPRIAHRKGVH